ncbi:uncharacterized protein RCC_04564 [Ramularia collo-cygni]|uniref:DUF1770-domain-containing protein n=1 Tax=Ramularia collo-cygni TaxID=112498 RepID=A0A2D3UZQ8_9PEZI|nr:uncharacterized protein RCC_04564 [Ramularia collo-cygni]CZT18720.1 uncharacterized protein RCC_04564 [Ramularia collo-cygni]
MANLEDTAIQFAETIQTGSINPNPSVDRDLAPETSMDSKQPVTLDHSADIVSEAERADKDEVPLSILRPLPEKKRQSPHLQLPDLRFEQSYLTSIRDAKGWQDIAYITIKDQVLMPLLQGLGWTLVVAGWRYSNSTAKFTGTTMGAKLRRWWWQTNNWIIPDQSKSSGRWNDDKTASQHSRNSFFANRR